MFNIHNRKVIDIIKAAGFQPVERDYDKHPCSCYRIYDWFGIIEMICDICWSWQKNRYCYFARPQGMSVRSAKRFVHNAMCEVATQEFEIEETRS